MPTRPFIERAKETRLRERWTQVYRESPAIFRMFEGAEDPDGLAARRLAELADVVGCRVLEIGCGTGWLTRHIASQARLHLATEPAPGMLQRAGDLAPAYALRARGECLPLGSGSFDRVVMSWVLLDLRPELRSQVLAECDRVLAAVGDRAVGNQTERSPQGSARVPASKRGTWVIENAGTGEFQALRNLVDRDGLGEARPLVDDCGFELIETVETEMRFSNADEARIVLGAILGDEVGAALTRTPRARIGLDLAILFRPVPNQVYRRTLR